MVGGRSMQLKVEDRVIAILTKSRGDGLDHLITSIPLTWLTMQPAIRRSSNEEDASR